MDGVESDISSEDLNLDSRDNIIIDKKIWESKDLFEVIISRYFLMGEEGINTASWEVSGKDGKNPSEQLMKLNKHLKKMSLMGILEENNPPILRITNYPTGEITLKNWHGMFVWLLMALILAAIGENWDSKISSSSSYWDSLLYFSMPIIIILAISSYVRKIIGNFNGVEVGHIVPLIFPFPSYSWPFGIIGSMGQKRIDLMPFPTRKSLAVVELVVPLMLFISGMILVVIGIMNTTNFPPEMYNYLAEDEVPTVLGTNVILNLILESLLGEVFVVRLQWLNLIGLAGIGLTIVAWGLLLPIPGFPGDRLLHSIIGPKEMKDGTIQTTIFVLMLVIMVIVFATSNYTPWIFLAAIGAWQRFSPENIPNPIVLDEYKNISRTEKNRIIVVLVIALIGGFPGHLPSYSLPDYKDGLDTKSWPTFITIENNSSTEIILEMEPLGILPVNGSIIYQLNGASGQEWKVSSEKCNDIRICDFFDVVELNKQNIIFSIKSPEKSFSPHILHIFVDVIDYQIEHEIEIRQSGVSGPISSYWELNQDMENLKICSEFRIMGASGNFSVDSPYWSIENSSYREVGVHDICLIGFEGAIQSLEKTKNQSLKLGPKLDFLSDDGKMVSWNLLLNNSRSKLQVFEGYWEIPSWFGIESEYIISHSDSGNAFCPSNGKGDKIDTNEDWGVVELMNYSSKFVTGNRTGNGSLSMGDGGWIAVCSGSNLLESYDIFPGVDIAIENWGLHEKIEESTFIIENRMEVDYSVSIEWHGDSPETDIWDLSIPNFVKNNSFIEVEILPSGDYDLDRVVWITADERGVVVHLSARCSIEGC